jgi:hypothetical protein
LFDYQPELWGASSYVVQSPVSLAVFREFVAGLEEHGDIQPTQETAAFFSRLASEFLIPRRLSRQSSLNQFLLLQNGFSIWSHVLCLSLTRIRNDVFDLWKSIFWSMKDISKHFFLVFIPSRSKSKSITIGLQMNASSVSLLLELLILTLLHLIARCH